MGTCSDRIPLAYTHLSRTRARVYICVLQSLQFYCRNFFLTQSTPVMVLFPQSIKKQHSL